MFSGCMTQDVSANSHSAQVRVFLVVEVCYIFALFIIAYEVCDKPWFLGTFHMQGHVFNYKGKKISGDSVWMIKDWRLPFPLWYIS